MSPTHNMLLYWGYDSNVARLPDVAGAHAQITGDVGGDDDLVATSAVVSLRCPLSGSRIVTPARRVCTESLSICRQVAPQADTEPAQFPHRLWLTGKGQHGSLASSQGDAGPRATLSAWLVERASAGCAHIPISMPCRSPPAGSPAV